jgi:hypothetical protein
VFFYVLEIALYETRGKAALNVLEIALYVTRTFSFISMVYAKERKYWVV